MIPFTTIRCSKVKVIGKIKVQEQLQTLRVAIELKVRIALYNFNPGIQICTREKVSALMNPHQFSILCAMFLNTLVDKICSRSILQSINN